jgi:glycolate oxidase iron-sulfur subunit
MSDPINELIKDADLCVKCGLCLPHCPTYKQTRNENESPRGRIALIQAWSAGRLELSKKLLAHIDHCLLCRSCERVCPAEVPYGRLVDRFRGRVKSRKAFKWTTALLKGIARHETVAKGAQAVIRFYQSKGLQPWAQRLGVPRLLGMGEIDRLLPKPAPQQPWTQDFLAAFGMSKGTVGLFIGCMGRLLDHETVNAAVHCLRMAGFNVYLPKQQTCCGALDQHDGDLEKAERLAAMNGLAFDRPDLLAVVTIASGCGGQLKEYKDTALAHKVVDISEFLVRSKRGFGDKLKPLTAAACLHTPCSLKNIMHEERGALRLLRQVPGLQLTELPGEIQCCGAAGVYMLEHPVMAKALAEDVLNEVAKTGASYLVTSNIGCSLHLAAALRSRGITLEVLHPITLLARQL